MRWRAPSIMRTRPASMSSATTEPVGPTRSAMAVALPPGAAARSATRSPGMGAEHRDHRLAALVLRRRPPVAHRGQARRIADAPRTSSESGTSAPVVDLGAGGAELLGERVDGDAGAGRDGG